MNDTERILRRLNQVANLNRDAGRTQTAETCYSAIKIINELNKQNDEADDLIAKLNEDNQTLAKAAKCAFMEGLKENRALLVGGIREEIEAAICGNTYPGFDSAHKPVMIWRARDGYRAVKRIIEKAAETTTLFSPRCPFDIGESVWTVIEDDEDEEKIFASECHVTDVSRKGVWISGYEPPEDDCSILIAWEEFGVDAFTRYEDALAEVERRKNGDG